MRAVTSTFRDLPLTAQQMSGYSFPPRVRSVSIFSLLGITASASAKSEIPFMNKLGKIENRTRKLDFPAKKILTLLYEDFMKSLFLCLES